MVNYGQGRNKLPWTLVWWGSLKFLCHPILENCLFWAPVCIGCTTSCPAAEAAHHPDAAASCLRLWLATSPYCCLDGKPMKDVLNQFGHEQCWLGVSNIYDFSTILGIISWDDSWGWNHQAEYLSWLLIFGDGSVGRDNPDAEGGLEGSLT